MFTILLPTLLLISQHSLLVVSYTCDKTLEYDATFKGEIKSPGYENGAYPDNLSCHYKITAPEDYRIKLTFKDVDIDPTGGCGSDNLWIAGWSRESGKNSIVTICGTEIPHPIISRENENVIELSFETDDMVSGRGFHLVYESGLYLELCEVPERVCRNRKCFHEDKLCDGRDDCGDGTDEELCGYPLIYPNDKECGSTPIEPDTTMTSPDRQVGGTAAVPHSWPWQVSLQRTHFEPNAHYCGGFIISPRYVVTAAHCVSSIENPSDLRITIGSHFKYKKSKYEMTRIAVEIVSFPFLQKDKLKDYGMRDDIALIKLNAPVKYSDGVQPVCIPPSGWETKPGHECWSTGWGETRGTGFSDQLKQNLQLIEHRDNCTFDQKTQICVNRPYNAPCHGDSGSPLVCKYGNKWYAMGIASFGTDSNYFGGICAMPSHKTVFSKVSDKSDWIRRMMGVFG